MRYFTVFVIYKLAKLVASFETLWFSTISLLDIVAIFKYTISGPEWDLAFQIFCTLFVLVDADGRIILRWIFRKWEEIVRTRWSWLRIGTGGGHL